MAEETARSAPSEATTFERMGAGWCEVTALGSDAFRVRLGGLLRPKWMVGVCNGLAREGLSIDRAHARRLSHDGSWIAELTVLAMSGARDPRQLTLIDFAETEAIPSPGPLRLDGYELQRSMSHGGTLQLTLVAPDAVGLLGSLLAAFAGLSLLPVEMHIETHERKAHDCLWLAASSQRAPSEADRAALDALLHSALIE